MRKFWQFLFVTAFLVADSAWAEPSPSPAADLPATRWSDSAEIIVPSGITIPGQRRCPGMWKLKRGSSTLFVLANLTKLPGNASWDSSCFKKLVNGANEVILINATRRTQAPETPQLPGSTRLQQVISPATYQHFLAVVERDGLQRERFEIFKPQWAGAYLLGAVNDKRGIHSEAYPAYIPYLAKQAKVRVTQVDMPTAERSLLVARNRLDAAGAESCLNAYLNTIDYYVNVLPGMAEAWGRGDMASVLKDYRELPSYACWPQDMETEVAALDEKSTDASVKSMDAALAKPGKSIAVVPLALFLKKDGVLDRLKAKGIDVISPVEDESLE